MKPTYIFLSGLVLLLSAACKEEAEKPKVIYENSPKTEKAVAKPDTTQIAIADLPIQIAETDYIIHPVGDLRINNDKGRYNSGGGGDVSYTISNYNEFEITGFLRNLKFQHAGSDSLKVLTDEPVLIQTATYLKQIQERLKKQIIVYTLADMDTNKDGTLDPSDIRSLYISTIDGDNFKKLSSDFEELVDWKIIDSNGRLYFRTIEDTNKNGEFDKNDVLHYNYVDLTAKEWTATPYKPL
ncbi:MAG TPA: hypothetical protein VGB50_09130 [Flavobacterium sp.]|jgi:hypothetical protein